VTMPQDQKYLKIKLGDVLCCVELSYILRTITLVDINPIPQAPSFINGFINFAGTQLMVADLSARFGLSSEQPYTLDTPMLICRSGDSMAAFIVDEIVGLVSANESSAQLEANFDCKEKLPFKGVLNCADEVCLWLDLAQVINILVSQLASECGPEILSNFESLVSGQV